MKPSFTMTPDQLPAVLAFARVAEHESFTRAAVQMGVSPSALSQTVRGLEAKIGVRLLHRTTRRVSLTEAGQHFLTRALPGLELIGGAFDELYEARGTPSGTLRLNLSRIACQLLVAPILSDFRRAFPEIRIDLTIDDGLTDLVAGRYDAGIRLGERLANEMVAVPISRPQEVAVVASPDYFRRRGKPRKPTDLHEHDCLRYRFASSGAVYRWEFTENGKDFEIDVDGPLIVNDIDVMIDAALQGLGIAHVMVDSVRAQLKRGQLVRVLKEWCPPFPGFYLYYPSAREMPLKLRVLIDFLKKSRFR